MSTKIKMLWKEWLASSNTQDEQAKRRRRYSLLLLLLLFIGFATYGTYSYFTTSTSLAKAKVKLDDGKSVQLGDGNGTIQSGDGTASANQVVNTNNPGLANRSNTTTNAATPTNSGNAGNTSNTSNQSDNNNNGSGFDNYKAFGEFDWVYVGKTFGNEAPSLADTFSLPEYNQYLETTDATTFNNVNHGDVFRKTVRLKITGDSKEVATTVINWGKVANEDVKNISGALYVKKGQLLANGQAPVFSLDGFTQVFANIPTKSDADYTDQAISVTAGEYLDIELVIAVKNDAVIASDVPLASILRQITVTLTQNQGSILDRAFSDTDLALEK